MPLALFDLDNTLITDDSDFWWGQYLVDQKIVNAHEYGEKNRLFFEDYERGELDIDQYLKFALRPLSRFSTEQLHQWREHFIEQHIRPIIAKGAPALIEKHRQRGDTLMIVSATNLFVTEPIAELLEIPHILATEPEMKEGRYTGEYVGIPTFQHGKVHALEHWLEQHKMNLEGSTMYSDSHNDLPLLNRVDHPVAVNPDDTLKQIAEQKSWPIIDLRS
jgi:HAD superfamily hydrolase (TIGR01490 family)